MVLTPQSKLIGSLEQLFNNTDDMVIEENDKSEKSFAILDERNNLDISPIFYNNSESDFEENFEDPQNYIKKVSSDFEKVPAAVISFTARINWRNIQFYPRAP